MRRGRTPGLFVTGTDTNVGKTTICAALMCRYRPVIPVRYWKPVQTGSPEDNDTAVVRSLAACSEAEIHDCGIRLPRPLSPHLSARLAGERIEIASLRTMAVAGEGWIVEGAGGALVPLNDTALMVDLIAALGLAAVVASRSSLGTINHTLLTVEALRARSIPVAGVVMIGEANPENRRAIEEHVCGRSRRDAAFSGFVQQRTQRLGADISRSGLHSCGFSQMNIREIDSAYVWHPYTQMQTAPASLPIARGEGVYLYTEDGRRILDGISSWWVNIHGHSHPRLNEALARQARDLEHVMFAGFTHRPAAELAERLVALLPGGLTRIFYSDNGSTAVEVALKMSFQYWQNAGQPRRREFIVLDHAYHGDTVGAMSASAESAFTSPFRPLLFPVQRAHAPYCFQCPVGRDRSSCSIDCLRTLESILALRGDSIAAVLVEPMLQGAGGMITWPVEFLVGVRRLCSQHGVLMIADEVLTGFGRTGKMFACEHGDVRPDIVCLSKALTGGYLPLGVTAATDDIYASFLSDDRRKTFFHGHSFTANPLACAAALASLDLLNENRSIERVKGLEALFRSRLGLLRSNPAVADVRILGGVAALELRTEQGGYLEPIGTRLATEFLSRGLLLRPLGNILYFMPPYAITDAEAHWAIDQIVEVLHQMP